MRVAFGRHSKELQKRPVTGGIAASRSHQAVERSREFTHSLFNSCSAGCLGTRLLSRSVARDPANSVRIARGMGAPSAANPAADRTEPVQLISTKNGRVVPRGGPSKRTTTNALSCLNLEAFPLPQTLYFGFKHSDAPVAFRKGGFDIGGIKTLRDVLRAIRSFAINSASFSTTWVRPKS
jgi:hypothetical protein